MMDVSPEDIEKAVNAKVDELGEELELEKRKCLLLLRRYKWNSAKIIDEFFTEKQTEMFVSAGICIDPYRDVIADANKDEKMECEICMEQMHISEVFALECGHINTCKNCWFDYLVHGVKSKQCVLLDCPTSKCRVTIPSNVWERFPLRCRVCSNRLDTSNKIRVRTRPRACDMSCCYCLQCLGSFRCECGIWDSAYTGPISKNCSPPQTSIFAANDRQCGTTRESEPRSCTPDKSERCKLRTLHL